MNEPINDKTSLTDDERIHNIVPLPPPEHLIRFFPIQGTAVESQIAETRANVRQILRVTVYTQSAAEFTQQSEVADGASELLHTILGEAGKHTRTSVGAYQLPKSASVELDLIASAKV